MQILHGKQQTQMGEREMRILSSDMAMQSAHAYTVVQRQQVSVQAWQGTAPDTSATNQSETHHTRPTINLHQDHPPQESKVDKSPKEEEKLPPNLAKMKQAIEAIMAWFAGRPIKIKVFSEADLKPNQQAGLSVNSNPQPTNTSRSVANTDWGVIAKANSQYFEAEGLSVSMTGKVTTADGKHIEFNLALALNRQYYSENQLEVRAGNALKDPLVINLNGQPAQIGIDKVQINNATETDNSLSLPTLNPGSGYLAFDRNHNGKIDDASELFGPQSGNGFAELSQLDEDGNGWIDEGDSGFSQLSVWQPDNQGNQQLVAIANLNIGAVYTGAVDGQFDYKTPKNQLQARMQAAGMFLYEDGRAGSIQQIDMTA